MHAGEESLEIIDRTDTAAADFSYISEMLPVQFTEQSIAVFVQSFPQAGRDRGLL
jgi:hypothetical protein